MANKQWPQSYLHMQHSAMRWLSEQGLTPEEIREFTWGRVDETTKTIEIDREFFFIKYDLKTGVGSSDTKRKSVKVQLKGTEQEYFFLKSKIPCFSWVFTAHPPKSWRREKAREALFPLEEIERICRGKKLCGKLCEIDTKSILTQMDKFGNLDITKANIANLQRIEEAKTK